MYHSIVGFGLKPNYNQSLFTCIFTVILLLYLHIYIYNCNYWWYLASISGDLQKYVLQYQWITGDIYCNYWTFWSFNVSFLSLSFCIGDRYVGWIMASQKKGWLWYDIEKYREYLFGGIPNPLEKWWSSSVERMKFPTYGKIIQMFQTTNQYILNMIKPSFWKLSFQYEQFNQLLL